MMNNGGIYKCDVDNYFLLLSQQDGKTTRTMNDWFFWFLQDNDIDPQKVNSVIYNELQQTIYTEEIDYEYALSKEVKSKNGIGISRIRHKHADMYATRSYPVIHQPSQILMDRWDFLMEVMYGNERTLCTAG